MRYNLHVPITEIENANINHAEVLQNSGKHTEAWKFVVGHLLENKQQLSPQAAKKHAMQLINSALSMIKREQGTEKDDQFRSVLHSMMQAIILHFPLSYEKELAQLRAREWDGLYAPIHAQTEALKKYCDSVNILALLADSPQFQSTVSSGLAALRRYDFPENRARLISAVEYGNQEEVNAAMHKFDTYYGANGTIVAQPEAMGFMQKKRMRRMLGERVFTAFSMGRLGASRPVVRETSKQVLHTLHEYEFFGLGDVPGEQNVVFPLSMP